MSEFTIVVEIDRTRPASRALTVSGAAPGKLPIMRSGPFAERHQLVDGLYAELLKKAARADKKSRSPKRKKRAGAALVAAPSTQSETLPIIEGDDAPADAGGGEPSETTAIL